MKPRFRVSPRKWRNQAADNVIGSREGAERYQRSQKLGRPVARRNGRQVKLRRLRTVGHSRKRQPDGLETTQPGFRRVSSAACLGAASGFL